MRTLIPELPRDGWVLLAGDAVSSVGSGLTLPFLLVYLHQVRGLGLGEAGLALSTVALRGRYNGVYTLAWTTGFAAGPALAGAVLAAGAANALMLGLIAACAIGVGGSLRLAQHLPPGIDVVDGEVADAPLPEPAVA